MSTSPSYAELAETPFLYVHAGRAQLLERPGYVLFASSAYAHACRFRLDAATVGTAVEDAREIAREKGASSVMWWVGDTATPADLGERLLGYGLTVAERATAVVLDRPPAGTPALDARPASSFQEFTQAQELDWDVVGVAEKRRAKLREALRGSWEREGRYGRTFVVVDRGEVISVGRSRYGADAVFLSGGSTAEPARRRGAYTALVHARWHDAVARGTPLLVTQASPLSAPILLGLGFTAVGAVDVYADRF